MAFRRPVPVCVCVRDARGRLAAHKKKATGKETERSTALPLALCPAALLVVAPRAEIDRLRQAKRQPASAA